MINQNPGKIFLSDQRGVTETEDLKRYATFNFDKFYNEHKEPFGNLYALNEEMLKASQSITLDVKDASYVIIIPVTGEVNTVINQGPPFTVDAGEVLVNRVPSSGSICITNPYESAPIVFLQIWIKAGRPIAECFAKRIDFGFDSLENKLKEIVSAERLNDTPERLPFAINIGRFEGRREATHQLKSKDASAFVFILAGAFELEGRLLHEGDGLALWGIDKIELEALSNNALIILIELMNL